MGAAAFQVKIDVFAGLEILKTSTKIRALASVVKYMTDEKRLRVKSKLPVANVRAKEIRP